MPEYFSGAITLFPHLIKIANDREIITYSDASQYIQDTVNITINPRMNALVVNARTHKPSEGFDYYKNEYLNCVLNEVVSGN